MQFENAQVLIHDLPLIICTAFNSNSMLPFYNAGNSKIDASRIYGAFGLLGLGFEERNGSV